MTLESDLLALFIERVPYVLPHVRVFRRNIVNTESIHGFRARAGIPGQADAYALVRGGRHVELETKAASGRMRAAQEAWRSLCAEMKIPHLVLRGRRGEAPEATVERWVGELDAVAQALSNPPP